MEKRWIEVDRLKIPGECSRAAELLRMERLGLVFKGFGYHKTKIKNRGAESGSNSGIKTVEPDVPHCHDRSITRFSHVSETGAAEPGGIMQRFLFLDFHLKSHNDSTGAGQ